MVFWLLVFVFLSYFFPFLFYVTKIEKRKRRKKSNRILLNDNFYLKSNYLGSFTSAIKQMKREKCLVSFRKAVLMVGSKEFSRHKA